MPTLYTTQTLTSSGGENLLPTSVALTKSLVALHAKVTTGSTSPTPEKGFQIILAATPYTLAAADAPTRLQPSYILYCEPKLTANGVAYYKSEPFVAEGLNLHAWVASDTLGANVTLDATVVEIA